MSLVLTNRAGILEDRARMFSKARHFFQEREILEVDVPLLTQKAPIDAHIDLISASCMGKKCYLQSSPEYPMKRLIAEGMGDIYQLSHVFREGELGVRHNPEFTMVEWYRIGFSFQEMIEETIAFLQLFLPKVEAEYLSYDEAFNLYAKSPLQDPDYQMAFEIEPQLGIGKFTVLLDFPAESAALAQVVEKKGQLVAERFEIFYQGIELANGYHELTDPHEQKKRLEEANKKREALKKECYPLDTNLIEALQKGLPDMCGVACGFDRLMMLKHEVSHIEEVLSYAWDRT